MTWRIWSLVGSTSSSNASFKTGFSSDVGWPFRNLIMEPSDATGRVAESLPGDHVLGADQPEATLVEYGDFGCPHCFAASRPVRSLMERYEALQLVWRHFPDPELHPGADLAAELSEAAAVRGKFWQAHSLLLTGRGSFSTNDLLDVARRLEVPIGEVESSLHERSFRQRVNRDVAGGKKAGVYATPTFFLNGRLVRGPWRRLTELVPASLAERDV
jgi:protein-disulfide isomerase